MNCPNCGEEIRTDLYDDTAGAVFVAMDSDWDMIYCWPAALGLKKHEGCIEFGRGVDCVVAHSACNGTVWVLSISDCRDLYFDVPSRGTAWLVKPHKDGYEWERVDEQIGFSNED